MSLTLSPIRLGPHIRRRSSQARANQTLTLTPSGLFLDSFNMDDFGLFTPTLSPSVFEDVQCGPRTAAEWSSIPFAMDADIAFDGYPRVFKSRAKLELAKTPVLRSKFVSDPPAAKTPASALRGSPEVLHETPAPTSPLVSRKKQRLEDLMSTVPIAPAMHLRPAVTPTKVLQKRGKRLYTTQRRMHSAKRSAITPTDLDVLRGRGGSMNKHPGNVRFREEVEKIKSLYRTSSHEKKNKLSWVSAEESFLASARLDLE